MSHLSDVQQPASSVPLSEMLVKTKIQGSQATSFWAGSLYEDRSSPLPSASVSPQHEIHRATVTECETAWGIQSHKSLPVTDMENSFHGSPETQAHMHVSHWLLCTHVYTSKNMCLRTGTHMHTRRLMIWHSICTSAKTLAYIQAHMCPHT